MQNLIFILLQNQESQLSSALRGHNLNIIAIGIIALLLLILHFTLFKKNYKSLIVSCVGIAAIYFWQSVSPAHNLNYFGLGSLELLAILLILILVTQHFGGKSIGVILGSIGLIAILISQTFNFSEKELLLYSGIFLLVTGGIMFGLNYKLSPATIAS